MAFFSLISSDIKTVFSGSVDRVFGFAFLVTGPMLAEVGGGGSFVRVRKKPRVHLLLEGKWSYVVPCEGAYHCHCTSKEPF